VITDTRDKLNEACYFLEQMKEKQSDRDAFKYNLSTFLSAARSVTWVMQEEFDKASGFKEWYEKAQQNMKQDSDMKFFNEKRTMTIHIGPVRPRAKVDVTIYAPPINITASALPPTVITTKADGTTRQGAETEPMPLPVAPVSDETKAEGKAVTEWRWYFEEMPDKDVVTTCEEHIKKLEALVAECESKFMAKQIGENLCLT